MPEIRAVFDRGRDPARNLATEDELFRSVLEGKEGWLVRFWINSPCLIRGKARNPNYGWYREDVAKELGIPVFERASGGGVVYHDEGNLNWSFFQKTSGRMLSPTQMFEDAARHVTLALGGLGVPAAFAPPNRIDASGRKVSGMAARSTPKLRLVHGTLLIDSDLRKLNRLCIPPAGCPPVANISEWSGHVEAAEVARAIVESLNASGVSARLAGRTVRTKGGRN
ncbi:MAG: hypothetical protein JRN08_09360 [Nitrososphaerota archaeon]|nr:hypothetical protein [Nitrososphaerota archaeon]